MTTTENRQATGKKERCNRRHPSSMKKFEYKILDVPAKGFLGGKINFQELTDKLNTMGKEGWELVTGTDTNMHQGASRGLVMILKREIN